MHGISEAAWIIVTGEDCHPMALFGTFPEFSRFLKKQLGSWRNTEGTVWVLGRAIFLAAFCGQVFKLSIGGLPVTIGPFVLVTATCSIKHLNSSIGSNRLGPQGDHGRVHALHGVRGDLWLRYMHYSRRHGNTRNRQGTITYAYTYQYILLIRASLLFLRLPLI